jgi:hypothetical protein
MSIKYLNQLSRLMSNQRACNPLPNIPISPPKRNRPPIQRVTEHGRALNRPFTQDGQSAPQDPREVEFGVRKDVRCFGREVVEVRVHPDFLEGDDGVGGLNYAVGDSVQSGDTLFRDIFQAPAKVRHIQERESTSSSRTKARWCCFRQGRRPSRRFPGSE